MCVSCDVAACTGTRARLAAAARSPACRRSWESRRTGRGARCPACSSTTLPSASSTSSSSSVSCTRPCRNEDASMPTPATAPPSVIDLQLRHHRRHRRRARASRRPAPRRWSCLRRRPSPRRRRPASTWSKRPHVEPPPWRRAARSRNRFEVSLASPTRSPPLPAACGSAPICAARRTASRSGVAAGSVRAPDFASGEILGVQERAAHRVVLARDVALAEHDLEQVRVPVRRAEHLGAADRGRCARCGGSARRSAAGRARGCASQLRSKRSAQASSVSA